MFSILVLIPTIATELIGSELRSPNGLGVVELVQRLQRWQRSRCWRRWRRPRSFALARSRCGACQRCGGRACRSPESGSPKSGDAVGVAVRARLAARHPLSPGTKSIPDWALVAAVGEWRLGRSRWRGHPAVGDGLGATSRPPCGNAERGVSPLVRLIGTSLGNFVEHR